MSSLHRWRWSTSATEVVSAADSYGTDPLKPKASDHVRRFFRRTRSVKNGLRQECVSQKDNSLRFTG